MRSRLFAIAISLVTLASCASLPMQRTSFTDLPGWQSDSHKEALYAFSRSCEKILIQPDERMLGDSFSMGRIKDWKPACKAVLSQVFETDEAAKNFFEAWFDPYHIKGEGTFTGYYEPVLRGSFIQSDEFYVPLYKRPPELQTGKAFYTRKEIHAGKLAGKNLELVWVDDPVSAFFLHVQGSGRVQLEDGTLLRLGYDGKNNQPYTSLGRYMIDEGMIKEEALSAEIIKEWLYEHPQHAQAVMEQNDSFVFFKILQEDGPLGAQGVVLEPERSLAVDSRYIAYSVPVWLDSTYPDETGGMLPPRPLQKLLIAQDTGSAIKGKVRGDVFFGFGIQAEWFASHMNQEGRYSILLPKQRPSRVSALASNLPDWKDIKKDIKKASRKIPSFW